MSTALVQTEDRSITNYYIVSTITIAHAHVHLQPIMPVGLALDHYSEKLGASSLLLRHEIK